MKKINSAKVLMECLGMKRISIENMSLHSVLINWQKAKNEDPVDSDENNSEWKTFLKIGFNIEHLLNCVDPAIRDVIERLYNLGIITTNSCSGHTYDTDSVPHIVIIFPDANIGKKFINNLRILFRNIKHQLFIQGDYHHVLGVFGPELPVQVCLKYQLPIVISWKMKKIDDANELGLVWTIFLAVINELDNKGVGHIDSTLFAKTHDEIMLSLATKVCKELGLKR